MSDTPHIQADHVVTVHYVLSDQDGTELFSTQEDGPLSYLHGAGEIMPGLETALEGHGQGDQFAVDLPADQAFGEHRDEQVLHVPLDQLEGEPKEGDILSAQMPDGNEYYFRVIGLDAETATLDGNHPLAGQPVHLEIKVEEVRRATAEDYSLREMEMPVEREGEHN